MSFFTYVTLALADVNFFYYLNYLLCLHQQNQLIRSKSQFLSLLNLKQPKSRVNHQLEHSQTVKDHI